MQLKVLYLLIFLLSGCSFSNPFISQFKDKGTLDLQPLFTSKADIITNTPSMVHINDYILWNNYLPQQGSIFYAYHLKKRTLTSYNYLIDSSKYNNFQLLYRLNDSLVTSVGPINSGTDLLIQDSIRNIGTHSFRVRDRDSYNWLEDIRFSTLYPIDETAIYFLEQTDRKRSQYGIFERTHQFFYPCTSCDPPGEKEMSLVSPDF